MSKFDMDEEYEELDFVQEHKRIPCTLTVMNNSGDCVSRQAVINRIANTCFWLSADNWEELIKCINSISPISTRPTGKWIKMPLIEAGQTYSHECSLCGRRILITDVGLSEFPYCHCGARMAESEERYGG